MNFVREQLKKQEKAHNSPSYHCAAIKNKLPKNSNAEIANLLNIFGT